MGKSPCLFACLLVGRINQKPEKPGSRRAVGLSVAKSVANPGGEVGCRRVILDVGQLVYSVHNIPEKRQ
jgi:hypothetical protein